MPAAVGWSTSPIIFAGAAQLAVITVAGVSAANAALVVLAVGVLTYTMRAGVILALANREVPVSVQRVLRNVGPAVLAALAINLAAGGEGGADLGVPEAAALVVAGVVAVWRRNLIWTLLSGMATLWVSSGLI